MKKNFFITFLLVLFFLIPLRKVEACYQLNSSAEIPAGFGAAYDVLSPGLETLIKTDCASPSVKVEAGNGSDYQYIYEKGYFYRDDAWREFTFDNADPDPENSWIIGKANVSIALSAAERLDTNYIVVYVCTWDGAKWKCGCRDSACTNNYWQLQMFKYPVSTCEDSDGDSYDSCSVGDFGDDGKELDCDDTNDWVNPGGFEVCDSVDNNCDGTIDEGCDDDNDGYCDSKMKLYGSNAMCPNNAFNGDGTQGRDCDDTNGGVNPGVSEVCDGVDNNCNKNTDEGCACVDNDGDGYDTCNPGDLGDDGLVEDCNDTAWERSPGVPEVCDSFDNDCDNDIDENGVCCIDNDGDGYDACSIGEDGDDSKAIDCDDSQWFKNPGAPETCDNYDNNCNGVIDENCDDDGDGYCNSEIRFYNYPVLACPKSNLVNDSFGDDCNDSDYNAKPGVTEVCDGIDNNCNGTIDENCNCINGQTQVCGSDIGACNSGNQTCVNGTWGACVGEITPVAEICSDNLDNNCDGVVNEGCIYCYDKDNDTYDDCALGETGDDGKGLDCNDNEYWSHPGAVENCDGIDNDCNGEIDEVCDKDNDSYCDENIKIYNNNSMCPGTFFNGDGSSGNDCDDNSKEVNIGALEVCGDEIDNNCNGTIDENCTCINGETQVCGSDVGACKTGIKTCTNATWGTCVGEITPVSEICGDGLDNNCDGDIDEGCGSGLNLYITEPIYTTVTESDYIPFNFNALGGKAPYLYTIESNLDGVLYEGYDEYFYIGGVMGNFLPVGNNVFTITATDMDGKSVSKQVEIEILSSKDLFIQIYAPFDGDKFMAGSQIYFSVNAVGGVSPYSYEVSSNLDGILSTDRYFPVDTLSTGKHTITAKVFDSVGDTYSSSITIEITEDMVVVVYPQVASYEQGETIYFSTYSLGGVNPYSLSFFSDIDGDLGNSGIIDSSRMSLGTHNITLNLVDGNGKEGTANAILEIVPAFCHDNDGDGFGYVSSVVCTGVGIDCDDDNANINPGIEENCSNGINDDCDNYTDECSVAPNLLLPASDGANIERGEDITIRVEAQNALYVRAIMQDPDGTNVKTVYLYDDGAHNDGVADDNIWAGIWTASGTKNGIYNINLSVYSNGIGYTDYNNLRTVNLIDSPDCIRFIDNGDSNEKVDIVFVADQYTADEMTTFADKALASAEYFLGLYPMSDNETKFNFSRVDIVQDLGCKDGSDCNSTNVYKAGASCPYDNIVLLVDNDFRSYAYLGTYTVVDANDYDYYWVVAHELGHAFARLHDEYVESGLTRTASYVDGSVNCETSPTCEKWEGVEGTGCYSGCDYSTAYYRSFYNGIMKAHGTNSYGPVSENHILEILEDYN